MILSYRTSGRAISLRQAGQGVFRNRAFCTSETRPSGSGLLLRDLSALPGNRFEALAGDRKGQYSIRINDQWRICFEWTDKALGHQTWK